FLLLPLRLCVRAWDCFSRSNQRLGGIAGRRGRTPRWSGRAGVSPGNSKDSFAIAGRLIRCADCQRPESWVVRQRGERMAFTTKTRYGAMASYSDERD